jgi:hypothetical protein
MTRKSPLPVYKKVGGSERIRQKGGKRIEKQSSLEVMTLTTTIKKKNELRKKLEDPEDIY